MNGVRDLTLLTDSSNVEEDDDDFFFLDFFDEIGGEMTMRGSLIRIEAPIPSVEIEN